MSLIAVAGKRLTLIRFRFKHYIQPSLSNSFSSLSICKNCQSLIFRHQKTSGLGYYSKIQYFASRSGKKPIFSKYQKLPKTADEIIKKRELGQNASAIYNAKTNGNRLNLSSVSGSNFSPHESVFKNEGPDLQQDSWDNNIGNFRKQFHSTYENRSRVLPESGINRTEKLSKLNTVKKKPKKTPRKKQDSTSVLVTKKTKGDKHRPFKSNESLDIEVVSSDKQAKHTGDNLRYKYNDKKVNSSVSLKDGNVDMKYTNIKVKNNMDIVSANDRNVNNKGVKFNDGHLNNDTAVVNNDIDVDRDVNNDIVNSVERNSDNGVFNKAKYKEKTAFEICRLKEHFNNDMLSYVEACTFSGNIFKAHSTLKYYHYMDTNLTNKISTLTHDGTNKVSDVRVYNALLHGWAKKHNLTKIQEIFSMMSDAEVQPSLQSYAAIFECLGKLKKFRHDVAERTVSDIEMKGFDIRDIFNKCSFVKDERHYIMKTLKTIDEDFTPYLAPESSQYVGPLVEKLNEPLSPDQVVESNPYHGVVTADDIHKQISEQIDWESQDYVTVRSIANIDKETSQEMKEKIDQLKTEWRESLKLKFISKLKQIKDKGNGTMTIEPYLRLFNADVYIDLVLLEAEILASEAEKYSPNMSHLSQRLGQRVFSRYKRYERKNSGITDRMHKIYKSYAEFYTSEILQHQNHRAAWQHLCNHDRTGADVNIPERKWSPFITKAIGQFLIDIILHDMQIDSKLLSNSNEKKPVPAFYVLYRSRGYKSVEEIKPHPVMVSLFENVGNEDITFDTVELPMVVPPIPWYSIHHGGSFLNLSNLIRLPPYESVSKLMENLGTSDIQAVLDSLNTLGACPWIINKRMLDIIISVFNNRGNKKLDIPPPLSEAPPLPTAKPNMNQETKKNIMKERLQIKRTRSEMYSLWCSELYKLSIANEFRDKIIWFPHNMDFRGRTYPVPTHFNHLGSDVTRSLLLFAKGKPLGENGLDWLKIHLINLTGFKKRSSNQDRLKYADEIMSEILDSADYPMDGRKWWQTTDEPWQVLACCMEIATAIRSPDYTKYVCHLPTHQDGSCNGLQHYAALGRDQAGAESVNLCPFDAPKDVYSDVVELVERERIKDALNGVEIAKILEGFVARKVIKQTIMTTVYGVTQYGARKQIRGQLQDIPGFPQEHSFKACEYLTEKTFLCLQEMFSSTKEIQDWFTLSAQVIASIRHKPVKWITPLGLPVVQPYHKMRPMKKYGVVFGSNSTEMPNAMKQKNAFPPNYIHSLDSTHMMLTSLFCLRAGITFVSVHDCFWTHACDISIMNKICREQFVALHHQPLLEELSSYLTEKFGVQELDKGMKRENQIFLNTVLERVPKRGKMTKSTN